MTVDEEYGTLFQDYKSWEDTQVSTLEFSNTHEIIMFAAMEKSDAELFINKHSITHDIKAYEYKDNIILKDNEVIVSIKVDTSDIFDLTNKIDYEQSLLARLTHQKINKPKAKLYRTVEIDKITNQFKIVYKITDYSVIKDKCKTL